MRSKREVSPLMYWIGVAAVLLLAARGAVDLLSSIL